MSKIQQRLSFKALFDYQASKTPVDIIAKSGQVFRVTIERIQKTEINTRNAMGHKKRFDMSEIHEIWVDKQQQLTQ